MEIEFKSKWGVWNTRKLFREFAGIGAPYCLTEYDKDGSTSLKRLYLECADITEYEFAKRYLGGMSHWLALCECKWFKVHLYDWRKELELKIRSEALKRVIQEGRSGGKSAFSANRFIVERGYLTKEEKQAQPKRGRPSKEEIKNEAKRLHELDNTLLEGLKVLNNTRN